MSEAASGSVYEAPALIMKTVVILPQMELGVVLREATHQAALEQAMKEHHLLVFLSYPSAENLIGKVGTLVLAQRNTVTPENRTLTLLRGLSRVRVEEVLPAPDFPRIRFRQIEGVENTKTPSETMQKVRGQIDEFVKLVPGIPSEIIRLLKRTDSPGALADLCAYSPEITYEERLDLLETLDPETRLQKISRLFEHQLTRLKDVNQGKTIPECDTCAELAEKAFEAEPTQIGSIITEFLNHVNQEHAGELLALLAEKYGPLFMTRRALR